MKKNMNDTDRVLRLVIATVLTMLILGSVIQMPESMLVWLIVAILTCTALTGSCPMYKLFGINTKDKRKYSDRHN